MEFIEKLLDSEQVEWVALGNTEYFEIANGGRKPVKASLRITGDTPYYGANNIQDYVEGFTHEGEYALIAEDGSASLDKYSIQYVIGKFWANNHVHVVRGLDKVNTRYLFHYLCIVNFIPYLTGGGRAKLTRGKLVEIQIPIPCPDNSKKSLEIQAEIVRILDAFTAMTAELTAELNLRQQQYNYYRDQLLSFEEGEVEWSCLNELTSRTSNIRWQETDETYQYIDLSSVSIENNSIAQTTEIDALNAPSRAQKLVQEHDVIFATTRPTQMRICLIPSDYDGAIVSTGYCVLRAIQEKVLSKWIYYCLTSTCFKYFLEENQSGSAYPAISDTKLKEYSIPVPSLEEQARIVAILDKFDALTNSITEGLPREIELRQQQYEYYRDLLLSFPKSEAA